MKTTKFLTTAFVLGSVALGTLGQAQEAAAIILQTRSGREINTETSTTFEDIDIDPGQKVLDYFLAEDYGTGDYDHAFWLSGLGDTIYHWYGDALFYTFGDEDGNIQGARLTGTIQNNKIARADIEADTEGTTKDSEKFKVDLLFEFKGIGADNQPWAPKIEQEWYQDEVSGEYIYSQIRADKWYENWKFFGINTSESTLTNLTNGDTLNLFDHSAGYHPVQFGWGANSKNDKLGLATWFEDIDSDILLKNDGTPRLLKQVRMKHLDSNDSGVENVLSQDDKHGNPVTPDTRIRDLTSTQREQLGIQNYNENKDIAVQELDASILKALPLDHYTHNEYSDENGVRSDNHSDINIAFQKLTEKPKVRVPEPTSVLALGLIGGGMFLSRRRQKG